MQFAEPQAQHQWLQKLVGEWTYEMDAPAVPGEEPGKFSGTETVRTIGGLWTQAEGSGKMPDGSPVTTMMTLGFDPQKGRFVGTWIGSMATYLWVYDGELDETKKILTLSAVGPKMSEDGGMANYRDVIEFKSDDHRVLTSHMQGDDGNWQQIVRVDYFRKK